MSDTDGGTDRWETVEYLGSTFELRRLTSDELDALLAGRPEDIDGELIREVGADTNEGGDNE